MLSHTSVQRSIAGSIRRLNPASQPARYTNSDQQLREKTGKQIAHQTVRRYGQQGLGSKKTTGKKRTREESKCKHKQKIESNGVCIEYDLIELLSSVFLFSVSAEMCEELGHIRRKLQRIVKNPILFLAEPLQREGDVENPTLVFAGSPPSIAPSNT